MRILVTGGTGFIGSHTVVSLIEQGYEVVILDNLCNSDRKVLDDIRKITGVQVPFYQVDIRNKDNVEQIFSKEHIDAVIHFAGLKAVGESTRDPLRYYDNNLVGTLNLVECMERHGVFKLVFSSSATVYGNPESCPITECFPRDVINPYGRTKLMIEDIMIDLYNADNRWTIALLRYFNPVGAHESGLLGERPKAIPNNLMPYIMQVAKGELPEVEVFGNDYPTEDGTGVRDYIHVCDLADGHIATLKKMNNGGIYVYNLGTGRGYSVLEVIKTFELTNEVNVPYVFKDRRPGDSASCYADPYKAAIELGWRAMKTLEDMCRDSWKFAQMNSD